MDTIKLEEMKNKFYAKLSTIISKKATNNCFLTREKYEKLKVYIKQLKENRLPKKPGDYQKLKRFDIITEGDGEKLIYPPSENSGIMYYAVEDELFNILHETHLSIGHGGRNRMLKEINRKYKNVTTESVMIYLNLCEECQKKFNVAKKGPIAKPMIFVEMNSRCQVDLIDLQSQEDRGYRFILVYQDNLTKFTQLRALKTNTVEEVADNILDIFTIFGAPSVLQSDNGREFSNKVINNLCNMWADLKIVHGKSRHSDSQDSVKRANQDVENMLSVWLANNCTTKWKDGLRFIQFTKNRTYHHSIKCSPYEAMFGRPAKIGIQTSNLPEEVRQNLETEEEIEQLLNSFGQNIAGEAVPCSNTENNQKENSIDKDDNLINIEKSEVFFDITDNYSYDDNKLKTIGYTFTTEQTDMEVTEIENNSNQEYIAKIKGRKKSWPDANQVRRLETYPTYVPLDPLTHQDNRIPQDCSYIELTEEQSIQRVKEESNTTNEDYMSRFEEYTDYVENNTEVDQHNKRRKRSTETEPTDFSITSPATSEETQIKKEYYSKKLKLMSMQTSLLENISNKLCQLVDRLEKHF